MRLVMFSTLALWLSASTLPARGPEKVSKETLDKLAVVKMEYAKRGVKKADVYDNNGKAWVVFYFPDMITDKDLAALPEPPLPCNFNLHLCKVTDAGLKE